MLFSSSTSSSEQHGSGFRVLSIVQLYFCNFLQEWLRKKRLDCMCIGQEMQNAADFSSLFLYYYLT